MIIAQRGRFGGWAMYAKDGKAKFVYNVLGIEEFAIEAEEPIAVGTHQCAWSSPMTAAAWPKVALSPSTMTAPTLYYDGATLGTGRVGTPQPMVFSADETTDIGYESGTSVTPDYATRSSRFAGKLHWAQIDLGVDDHDHFIDPDERFRITMARQ